MGNQIAYTAETVNDIKATLERQAATIETLVGIINRGETLSPGTLSQLESKWGNDILESIKRLETEGQYV